MAFIAYSHKPYGLWETITGSKNHFNINKLCTWIRCFVTVGWWSQIWLPQCWRTKICCMKWSQREKLYSLPPCTLHGKCDQMRPDVIKLHTTWTFIDLQRWTDLTSGGSTVDRVIHSPASTIPTLLPNKCWMIPRLTELRFFLQNCLLRSMFVKCW